MKRPTARPSTPSSTLSPALVGISGTGAGMDSRELVEIARETRRNAEAFANTVRRFGSEMPDHLDRFHEAMVAFRSTAQKLRG